MVKPKIIIDLSIPSLALFLIFAAAKIFGLIEWSWTWVLSPLWIPYAFIAILILILAILLILATIFAFMLVIFKI